MRLGPFALFGSMLLAGCAGQLRDYVGGSRSAIVTPQLLRYGYDLTQSRCISERLGEALTPSRLRKLARSAGSVTRSPLAPRDFAWVVTAMDHGRSSRAFEAAVARCPATATAATAMEGARGVTILGPGELPPPSGAVAPSIAPAAPRSSVWLNLGAAGSGQSIAVDATTIEEEGSQRRAWFRMTDPGARPSDNSYLLSLDCARRTINPQKRRRRAPDGTVAEDVDYPDNPLPVEGGTVMEIAWLSMCT